MWLTEQSLELFDGQHRVVLRAVMEVVRHLGHVPGHGPAQRDPHRLTGRRPDRRRPQGAGHGQESHAESRGEHVAAAEAGRFTHGEQSLEVTDGASKVKPDAVFFPCWLRLFGSYIPGCSCRTEEKEADFFIHFQPNSPPLLASFRHLSDFLLSLSPSLSLYLSVSFLLSFLSTYPP